MALRSNCFLNIIIACSVLSLSIGKTVKSKRELEEKSPYDHIREQLSGLYEAADTGLPVSSHYEVEEENEDYPEDFVGAESSLFTSLNGIGGIGTGIGQLGYGGLGFVGQGIGQQGLQQGIQQIPLGIGVGGIQGGGIGLGHGLIGGLGGVGGVGGIGGGLGNGLGGGLVYQPYFGLHGTQVGGGYVDKKGYEAAEKKAGDENIEKFAKKAEEEKKHGQEGFEAGSVAAKSEKGDSGFYKDEEAKKKAVGDEKQYEGAQKFDKSGEAEQAHKVAKSHKKGHVTKGFKSSSSKNEEEKTETFYDEAHDEADHKNAGANQGSFGEKSATSFKGNQEHAELDAKKGGKEGHFAAEHKTDDAKANKGEFLEKGYKGGEEHVVKANNLGAQSILGHQEAAGEFQKQKQFGIHEPI